MGWSTSRLPPLCADAPPPPALNSEPPEREIKYKSEKKWWEEQHKGLAARLAALTAEVDAYRGNSKAPQLEERIQVGGRVGEPYSTWVGAVQCCASAGRLPGCRPRCDG